MGEKRGKERGKKRREEKREGGWRLWPRSLPRLFSAMGIQTRREEKVSLAMDSCG